MRQRTIATDRCGHLIQTVEQISNKLGATKHLTLNPPGTLSHLARTKGTESSCKYTDKRRNKQTKTRWNELSKYYE